MSKPRKRFYVTASGHDAGVDFTVRSPDRRALCSVLGLSLFGDASGVERARADAGMIVRALNAYAKGG